MDNSDAFFIDPIDLDLKKQISQISFTQLGDGSGADANQDLFNE